MDLSRVIGRAVVDPAGHRVGAVADLLARLCSARRSSRRPSSRCRPRISVSEAIVTEASLDDRFRDAPVFDGTYATVTVAAVAVVLVPGAALVPILFLTQVLNAILLLPLLVMIVGMARDRTLMGEL